MNFRDVTNAINDGDLPSVRAAFRALVSYPDAGRIGAASPGLLIVALNRACRTLAADAGVMPLEACAALSVAPGSTYAQGVLAAQRAQTELSQRLIRRFAA